LCFASVPVLIQKQPPGSSPSLLRSMSDHILILVDAHPRRPMAGRLPARHAHTCHAPSGFAAGASRRPHGQMPTRSASVSPHHSFSPSGMERGMLFAASAAPVRRSRHRPPLRHTGLTALPCACRRSAFGASGFAASVSRPIFGSNAECAFPSPSFRFCSLLSARCLPAKSTS
jgi:hypothetical protein